MVLEAVTIGVAPIRSQELADRLRIRFARSCFLHQLMSPTECFFDFPRQRVEIGPGDMDGTEKKDGASIAVYSPEK